MPYQNIVIIDNIPYNGRNTHHAQMLADVLTDGFSDFVDRTGERALAIPNIIPVELQGGTIGELIKDYDGREIIGDNYYLVDACLLRKEENNITIYSDGLDKLSGCSLAKYIKEQNPNSKISLMSRLISIDITDDDDIAGFLPVINKPIDSKGKIISLSRPRSLYIGYLKDEYCVEERLPEFCNVVFCNFFGKGVI